MEFQQNHFHVGEWEVEPLSGTVSGPDGEVHLQPKTMDVLVYLAKHAGEVVTRETLLAAVWGERAVSDEPLTRCIANLRRVLGDERSQQRYIETISKRGYRLKMQPTRPAERDHLSTIHRTLWLITGSTILGLAIALVIFFQVVDRQGISLTSPLIAILPFSDLSPAKDAEYLSTGIADDLINYLVREKNIAVLSRTSSFEIPKLEKPLNEIAHDLNIVFWVEGSFEQFSDRFVLHVHLIDAASGVTVWAQIFEERLDRLHLTHHNIGSAIVTEAVKILGVEATRNKEKNDVLINPKAFELF